MRYPNKHGFQNGFVVSKKHNSFLLFQALRHLGQHGRVSEEPVLDVDELQDQLWGVRQQMHRPQLILPRVGETRGVQKEPAIHELILQKIMQKVSGQSHLLSHKHGSPKNMAKSFLVTTFKKISFRPTQ